MINLINHRWNFTFQFGLSSLYLCTQIPIFHSFPKCCNSSEVDFSITKSMWRVPSVMGTELLYVLLFCITTNMSFLSAFTPGTWKFTSVYPRYGMSIPPDPSISNNCHSCLHGRPNFSAKLFEIDEMLASKSINPVTLHPSIVTLASLTLQIKQCNGSGL